MLLPDDGRRPKHVAASQIDFNLNFCMNVIDIKIHGATI